MSRLLLLPQHRSPVIPRRLAFAAAFACLAAAGFAQAAGFDCKRARSAVEISICSDPQLSRLDGDMNVLYQRLHSESAGWDGETGARSDSVGAAQQQWLRRRDACKDRACLAQAYRERIDALKQQSAAAGLSTDTAHAANAYRFGQHGDFAVFIEDLRIAVETDDRSAALRMVALPYADYSSGRSCLDPADDCSAADYRATASSRTAGELEANYARIFTPAVRAALKARAWRAFSQAADEAADESGEVQATGPIGPGEYLLENQDNTQQRVFKKIRGVYKLQRAPFYS